METMEIILTVIGLIGTGAVAAMLHISNRTQKTLDRLQISDDYHNKKFEMNQEAHTNFMITMSELNIKMPTITKTEEELGKLKTSDTKQWMKIDEHTEDIKEIKTKVA